ncbi:MAG: HD domain-containing protein [Lachnospiraceae bacterium]|nr:HD domain-containing protein [Lachnospiraceae bacterium]
MKRFYRFSLLILAVFFIFPARAYAAGGDRRDLLGRGTDYTAILYNSNNGLPTSEANAIAQSSDGFIWLGGYSGLIRYDGTNFTRFDSTTGISSVFSLYVDKKDRVWIGTNENGVALYDHGNIRVYGIVEALKSYSIRAMTEDPEGNILIATTQGLAYVSSEDLEIHPIDDPQVNLEYITELVRTGRGEVYGLTQNGAVFQVENLRISAFYNPEEFGSETVNAIYSDPNDPSIIYMGTTGSEVITVDVDESMKVVSRKSADPQKNINTFLKANGLMWIAATNGIGYFDERAEYHELSDIPMNNSVGNIISDHEGNMWFTSTRQGVMKLVPDRFTDISALAGIDPMVVNSTCINGDYLYLATDSGLAILEKDTYAPVTNELTEMLEDIRIRCILNDSKGNVWFCTYGDYALVCYDPEKDEITSYNESNILGTSRIRDVIECADGSMAAATVNGVYIVKDGKVTAHYDHESGINTEEILCLEQAPDGRLYLGSDGDGIYVVDGGKVTRLGHEDGLTSEVVMRIKWDAERGVFWLVTSNSIEYMKDGVITAVSNFPYSNNYDIYFDDHGGAWVLASNGIYITTVDELIANEDIEYSFYNTRSGLPYIATGNSRNYISDDGKLFISGTTGVCAVNINGDENNNSSVMLVIPSVEVDDSIIPTEAGEQITLPARSRRITINAYALTYGLSNPRITYYLEGFDDEPIATTKQDMQPVIYTNLDGGRYVFHLNLINDETGIIEKTTSVTINKERSLYESIWFWIGILLVSVGLISLIIYSYFRKKNQILLKKQEEDRKFISQIMHTFAKCIDMRDSQNRGHSFRVAYYTRLLAEKLRDKRGYTDDQIEEFHNIALLHDIGKLSIPDSILNKPQGLNDEEYAIMKTHAENGGDLLKNVNIVKNLAAGAGCHHERMDGKGYPKGLKGEDIPEVARIIAVADTFDAMYSTRPYRKQLELSVVLDEIKRIRGTQLEEDVVDALLELAGENKLDKAKVDAAIAETPEDAKA